MFSCIIVLVVYDYKKVELFEWVKQYIDILCLFCIVVIGIIGVLIYDNIGFEVYWFKSGLLGGDQ